MRHSSARNCIERFFGVVKRRFRIVGSAPEYNLQTQARIIHAICALHNFIMGCDPTDATIHIVAKEMEKKKKRAHGTSVGDSNSQIEGDGDNDSDNEAVNLNETAEGLRNQIAKDMWTQYLAYIAENRV